MEEVVLRVGPAASGWEVECDRYLEPTYYRSGARAEEIARSLALHLTGTGCDVRLLIRDRSDRVVATHRYFGG